MPIKILMVLIVVFILCFGGVVYTVTSTAIPLKAIASVLNDIDGVTIEGIDGSLTSGVEVKKIAFTDLDNGADFLLENLVVDYSLDEMDGDKKLIHIKNINIDKFIIIGGDSVKSSSKSTTSSNDKGSKSHSQKKNALDGFDLLIDNVSIKNVVLKENQSSKGFSLELFIIENLFLNKRGLKFDKIDIVSSLLKLSGFSKLTNGNLTHVELKGSLSSQAIDKLNEELPFEIVVKVENLTKLNVNLNAYANNIQLQLYSYKEGLLKFDNMDFAEKFQNDWPISWIDGQVSMPVIGDKVNKQFTPAGTLEFMHEGKKYNVVEGSYSIDGGNDDEEVISLFGQSIDSKVKVEFINRHSGNSELIVTEQ
jgi:hypothetical protein